MLKNKFIVGYLLFVIFGGFAVDANAAAAPKAGAKMSVLSSGTKVRAKVDAKGLYSQECYESYFGCMDQFCITENEDGGTCSCSDDNAGYEAKLAKIQIQLDDANRLSTVEVEKITAGAQADIIFNGAREYDKDGNVVSVDNAGKGDSKANRMKDLFASFDAEEEDEDAISDFSDQKGAALLGSARELCLSQIPESCSKDMTILMQLYSTQIKSDCKAFDNFVQQSQKKADEAIALAQADVRDAVRKNFDKQNEFDRGTCMVNFRNCMKTNDACGGDWMNCVSTVASENMQNEKTKSVANTTVSHATIGDKVDHFGITDTTYEMLDAKRNICENILDKCVAVRGNVWTDFLREAAPTIKLAELNVESKFRQSCLKDISECVLKNTDNIEAFLAYPDIARSTCKTIVDPCERMEPQIWSYAMDKLASMRVDACTEEVKQCFTAAPPIGCGEDFSACIGMDFNYLHQMCPVDKLVVCKQGNPNFAMSDIDSMLMGFYLNVDNSALENCQNQVEAKMQEICGSTTDCNKFAADDTIGTGSLQSQKDGDIYRVTGMISFGSIKMGDASGKTKDISDEGDTTKLGPGEIGVAEYLSNVRAHSKGVVKNADAIIDTIDAELNNIVGTINRTIELIEQDPKIQYCVTGRDLSQINGKAAGAKNTTSARFPGLLNQLKMQIAVSALRRAQDNYNKKLNEEISKATQSASDDIAQYMCQQLPMGGSGGLGVENGDKTPLMPPYSISFDVGAGQSNAALSTGGSGQIGHSGSASASGKDTNVLMLAGNQSSMTTASGGVTKTMTAIFTRETRNCHYCSTTVTESCSASKSNGFLGIGGSTKSSCTTSDPVEKCEDIKM